MIVDPDFVDHWKTRLLVGSLDGDESAPMYVLRIWAHCQNRRQWQFDNLTHEALKALCRFPGHSNKLEASLVASGFIRRDGKMLIVCNWDEYNKSLIAAWNNGKKGKTSNPDKTPTYKVADSSITSTEWNRVRQAVVDRDGLVCRYCRTELVDALIDHILPASRGGTNDLDNLCVCCRKCNTSKQDKTLSEWRGPLEVHGGSMGAGLDRSREDQIDKKVKRKPRAEFVEPSVNEVAAYCAERNNKVDAQVFVDFYTGKGWMIGKNKMKDWRASVRTWEKGNGSDTGRGSQNSKPNSGRYVSNCAEDDLAGLEFVGRETKTEQST